MLAHANMVWSQLSSTARSIHHASFALARFLPNNWQLRLAGQLSLLHRWHHRQRRKQSRGTSLSPEALGNGFAIMRHGHH